MYLYFDYFSHSHIICVYLCIMYMYNIICGNVEVKKCVVMNNIRRYIIIYLPKTLLLTKQILCLVNVIHSICLVSQSNCFSTTSNFLQKYYIHFFVLSQYFSLSLNTRFCWIYEKLSHMKALFSTLLQIQNNEQEHNIIQH